MFQRPNPDKAGIDYCRLNIEYSIDNIQSFEDRKNSLTKFFCHKMQKIISKVLYCAAVKNETQAESGSE
jgi:hypothetical protein